MTDTADRFSDKVAAYARYRWPFAPEAIDALFDWTSLDGRAAVADIGAGTGMLSRLFIGRITRLYAIEPNPLMRNLLATTLGRAPRCHVIDALSDATTLPDASVDLIVVGRALHWFPPASTRTEFRRILKPGGWLASFQVPCQDQALLDAIYDLRSPDYGWDMPGDKWHFERTPLSYFCGHDDLVRCQFPDIRRETWTQFFGRLTSLSPAPTPDHPLYPAFERGARAIFDRFRQGNELIIPIATDLILGRVAHAGERVP